MNTKEKRITNLTMFYKHLPPKICTDCGYEIEEQHESYMTKCERCLSKERE
jgi:predicted Zn-ribbon and HTH transcriptional regulator